ncbi:MAG: hypothetical protein AB7U73_07150 [Pirellulales bacterium]
MLADRRVLVWLLVSLLGLSHSAIAQDPFSAEARAEAAAATEAAAEAGAPATEAADTGKLPPEENPVAELSKRLQKAELNIRRELVKTTTVDFVETPLLEVVMFLQDLHQIPVKLDQKSLEDSGILDDEPVTCSLSNVSLHSVLRVVLEPLDLTYVVDGEVLMITTLDHAEGHPEVRVYDVEDLASDKNIDELVDVIIATCTPESWEQTGGLGRIQRFDGRLVVRQSGEVQWQIARLLADLRVK